MVSIPFIIVYPELSITDGLLVLSLGFLAIAIAAAGLKSMAGMFFGIGTLVMVFELGTYVVTQIGLGPAPLVVAAILTGDTVVGVLMPVFLIANMRDRFEYAAPIGASVA